ncbi:hypothetical protein HanXRQr2_Chr07g0297261 [Helianthus annuus]|uniref:Uncharacterized protein n=1 Tax=Helianthus annuus TaxID=4232 RepID=A0A9K3ILK4_HELAN|nr:hypothetical protein HanXRQr2_Chr07g0297261 [Helianthus annuus]KAJ0904911.1 hypothetical protein HanPSC8_Chr07g0287781 [Helianthus annuus]
MLNRKKLNMFQGGCRSGQSSNTKQLPAMTYFVWVCCDKKKSNRVPNIPSSLAFLILVLVQNYSLLKCV